jgi:putative cofactor-binding repeat protein
MQNILTMKLEEQEIKEIAISLLTEEELRNGILEYCENKLEKYDDLKISLSSFNADPLAATVVVTGNTIRNI